MDDSVFRSWAERLRVRGRSENSRAMHVELVDLVRGIFPQQAMRFMRLADELRALQQGHPPMVTIRTPYATDDFTQWFGDARNGHQPEFRALLLKWLWAHHRDKAEAYLTRWGIEPPAPVKPESPATPLASTLAILPVPGMNFVYPGEHHHVENAAFSFALTVTVLNNGEPFTALGFRARHIASDGCYSLPGEQQIFVNGSEQETDGDDFRFIAPILLADGTAQIRCLQEVRPPLMIQTPDDCFPGEVRLEILAATGQEPEAIERYFRFEGHGDLTPIAGPRDHPILSDRILQTMRERKLLDESDFGAANRIRAIDGYQIVRFGAYRKTMRLPGGNETEVTPDIREFLAHLHALQKTIPESCL